MTDEENHIQNSGYFLRWTTWSRQDRWILMSCKKEQHQVWWDCSAMPPADQLVIMWGETWITYLNKDYTRSCYDWETMQISQLLMRGLWLFSLLLSWLYPRFIFLNRLLFKKLVFLVSNTFHMSPVSCLGASFCFTILLSGLPSQLSLLLCSDTKGSYSQSGDFWECKECLSSLLTYFYHLKK